MLSLDELINKRRSIRKYKPDPPDQGQIEEMVHCASMAPSPSNSRPVRFIRIITPGIRKNFFKEIEKGYQTFLGTWETKKASKKIRNLINAYWRYSKFIMDAPVLFAVGTITDGNGFSEKLVRADIISHSSRGDTDFDITVGLALKGFILKGEELGISSCILTAPLAFASNPEDILRLDNIKIKCFVTAGFPDETPAYVERSRLDDIYKEV